MWHLGLDECMAFKISCSIENIITNVLIGGIFRSLLFFILSFSIKNQIFFINSSQEKHTLVKANINNNILGQLTHGHLISN